MNDDQSGYREVFARIGTLEKGHASMEARLGSIDHNIKELTAAVTKTSSVNWAPVAIATTVMIALGSFVWNGLNDRLSRLATDNQRVEASLNEHKRDGHSIHIKVLKERVKIIERQLQYRTESRLKDLEGIAWRTIVKKE